MATIKLYDLDGYMTRFQGKVTACERAETKKLGEIYEVVLDRTCFFPEEGGQTPDRGYLDGQEVLDVQIQKDHRIIHTVKEPVAVGTVVTGEIDWDYRFSNMQQHSAEHIFSGLADRLYGYKNVGFHLSDQIVTMDFDGVFTRQQLEDMEWEVNKAIVANVPVRTGYPTAEELENMTYRSKLDFKEGIRIVEIEGYDKCACCAPHVARTGEIGMFKIQYMQNYKGGVRISFLSGFRALEEYRAKAGIITSLSEILTTNQELLAEHVTKQKNKIQTLKNQLNMAKQEILLNKAEQIPTEQENVVFFESDLEPSVMRNVINHLVEKHKGICGIFVEKEEGGFAYILGSKAIDCRKVGEILKNEYMGKGGGSAVMIQGSVAAPKEQLRRLFENLENNV